MTWVKIRGLDGLVWQPDPQPANERKHNCRDCFSCQMCSDTRCAQCLNRKQGGCGKRGKGTCGKRPQPRKRSH
jgi:hypothetical protein